MTGFSPDPREAKLPKWAQEELAQLRTRITGLEQDCTVLKQQLEDLPAGTASDTVLVMNHVTRSGDDVPDRPLGNGAHIRYADFYDVVLDQTPGVGYLLTIQADGPIAVIPTSDSAQVRIWKLQP